MSHSTRGRLDVVATPIGNLGDLSARARLALEQADCIAAEDTRRTGQLLAALGVDARGRLLSLHDHNESSRLEPLVQQMLAGRVIALVSDAGTPLLSDPGYQLVRAAAAAGIAITPVPGPCAVTAALSVAGMATDRFAFEGFLPAKAAQRRAALVAVRSETRTLVWFESPHRLGETLQDMAEVFGADRRAVVAREITKIHETIYRATLGELQQQCQGDVDMTRGEITLLVAGAESASSAGAESGQLLVRALRLLLKELPPGRAAAIAAQLAGVSRQEAYAAAQALGG